MSRPGLAPRGGLFYDQAVGDHDIFFCPTACGTPGSATDVEPRYWSTDACLEVFVQANTGHDNDLHPNAPTFFAAATDWLNRRIGSNSTTPPTRPCPSQQT